jgi:3-hydroxyisobutyrate dehydrogenase-like beta-hydroxyacid dehydrogenase
MEIGFIGLGNMGAAIAINLIKGGQSVSIWNRTATALKPVLDAGAMAATDAEAVFAAPVVFSMLADDAAIQGLLLDSGVLERVGAAGRAGGKRIIHVNMATVSAAFAEELAQRHADYGIDYIAAPVMGRPDVAAAAKLTILAAGPAAARQRVQPLFDLISQKTVDCGERAAQANVLKLAVNMMLVSAIEAMSEASALVHAYEIEPKMLIDLVSGTLFPGPVYQGYGGMIARSQYEPAGFRAALGLKDVRLAIAAGEQQQVPLPLASLLRDSLLEALAHGDGDKDLASLGAVSARRSNRPR